MLRLDFSLADLSLPPQRETTRRASISGVQDKVQLVALPAAIYDAYQRVLPKQPDRLLSTATDESPVEKETVQTSLDFDL